MKTIGKVARFLLLEKLGEGAFGKVYRAFDPLMEREIAIKISTFNTSDQKRVSRFVDEAKAAGKLHHPHIVPVFESGRAGHRYFIVSELVSGRTLSASATTFANDLQKACSIVRALSDALQYAHENGVVHRDVKPANIMLDEHTSPRLMDFGLAKQLEIESHRTVDGSLIGTPYYMSPEQARGDVHHVGPASDLYSLGVVLYELITGRRPFKGSQGQVIHDHQFEVPADPRQLNGSIDRDLAAICLKALAKNANERYATMAEFAGDLDRWSTGQRVTARHATLPERASRWCRANRAIASLAATIFLLLLVLIAGGIGFTLSLKRKEKQIVDEVGVGRTLEETVDGLKSELERLENRERELTAGLRESQEKRVKSEKERAVLRADVERLRKQQLDQRENNTQEAQRVQDLLGKQLDIRNKYLQSVAQADAAINEGRRDHAKKILDACPKHLRKWEWEFIGAKGKLVSPQLLEEINIGGEPDTLAVGPRGRYILFGMGNAVSIYSVIARKEIQRVSSQRPLHEKILATVFNSRGDRFAVATSSGVQVFRENQFSFGQVSSINFASLNPDTPGPTSRGPKSRGTKSRGTKSRGTRGPKSTVSCVLAMHGEFVAVGLNEKLAIFKSRIAPKKYRGFDGLSRLFVGPEMIEVFDRIMTRTLPGKIVSLEIAPSGNQVICAHGRSIQIYDVSDKPSPQPGDRTLKQSGIVSHVSFGHAGSLRTVIQAQKSYAFDGFGHTTESMKKLFADGIQMATAPRGEFCATSDGKRIALWQLTGSEWTHRTRQSELGRSVLDFSLSSDGRRAIIQTANSVLKTKSKRLAPYRYVDTQQNHVWPLRCWGKQNVNSGGFAVSRHGKVLSSAGLVTPQFGFSGPTQFVRDFHSIGADDNFDQVIFGRPNAVDKWASDTGQSTNWLRTKYQAKVAVSKDGSLAAISGVRQSRIIKLYDMVTGRSSISFKTPDARIDSFSFDPSGQSLVVKTNTRRVTTYDVKTGKQKGSFIHSNDVYKVSFTPDGERLAIASSDDFALVDMTTGRPLTRRNPIDALAQQLRRWVYGRLDSRVAYSPSKECVAILDGEKTRVENVENGKQINETTLPRRGVQCLAVNDVGSHLALGWDDGFVSLLNLQKGMTTRRFKAHTETVRALTFVGSSVDRLASAANGEPIKLWDAVSGQLALALPTKTQGVVNLDYDVARKAIVAHSRPTPASPHIESSIYAVDLAAILPPKSSTDLPRQENAQQKRRMTGMLGELFLDGVRVSRFVYQPGFKITREFIEAYLRKKKIRGQNLHITVEGEFELSSLQSIQLAYHPGALTYTIDGQPDSPRSGRVSPGRHRVAWTCTTISRMPGPFVLRYERASVDVPISFSVPADFDADETLFAGTALEIPQQVEWLAW